MLPRTYNIPDSSVTVLVTQGASSTQSGNHRSALLPLRNCDSKGFKTGGEFEYNWSKFLPRPAGTQIPEHSWKKASIGKEGDLSTCRLRPKH